MTAPARPGFLDADVDALQRLDATLGTAAHCFHSIRTQISHELSHLEWHGADADAFRHHWHSRCAPALQRISDTLSAASRDARRQRDQQEAASRVSAAAGSASTGTTSTGTTSTGTASGEPVALAVPFYSQFAGGHGFAPGNTACFRASKAMAAQLGAEVLGADQRIQVAAGENSDGSVRLDTAQAVAGRSYIDEQLDAGRPVVVGVSHKAGYNGNIDHITDHFVVITGRGTDPDGHHYYTFNDPATRSAERGSDASSANRFHLADNGSLYSDGSRASGYVVDRHIEISMVRRNR